MHAPSPPVLVVAAIWFVVLAVDAAAALAFGSALRLGDLY
jgi:hypothetical protein